MKAFLATIVAIIFVNVSYSQPAWQYVYKKTLVGFPAIVKAAKDTATADTMLFKLATDNSGGIMTDEQAVKIKRSDSVLTVLQQTQANAILQPRKITTARDTLKLTDSKKDITVDAKTNCTIYIPANLPPGFTCRIFREQSENVTFAALPGVTINSASGFKISYRYRDASIYCKEPLKFTLTGNLTTR